MLEDEKTRMLYTTVRILALVLATKEANILELYRNHGQRLTSGMPEIRKAALEVLRQNRVEFAQPRFRQDAPLPSLPDITFISSHIKTPDADEFRASITQFALDNIRRSAVSFEEFQALQRELEELREFMHSTKPALHVAASAAGSALNAQKGTKAFRLLKGGKTTE